MEFLKDWWPFGGGLLAALLGYNASQVRSQHRLETIERRVEKAEEDIEVLQSSGNSNAVTLGIIQTTLTQIKESLDRLHEDRTR